jgi:hypothetical protein
MYLCNMRAKFDFEPDAGMLYGTKLYLMVGTLERPNIWILSVAACSTVLFDDLRTKFVDLLSGAVRSAEIESFEEFVGVVEGFIWCDAAFRAELRDLKDKMGLR